jgi:hypothetical protein
VALRLFIEVLKSISNTPFGFLYFKETKAMIATIPTTQTQFYREFIMGRGKFDPAEFGVNLERDELTDQMVNEFNTMYRGNWTIDELCLHPREATRFCDDVRRKYAYWDLPDDIILRSIMNRSKAQ